MSFDLELHTTHHLTCWEMSNEFRYYAISDTSLPRSLKSSFADLQFPMTDYASVSQSR
jgi:hypothetical protein